MTLKICHLEHQLGAPPRGGRAAPAARGGARHPLPAGDQDPGREVPPRRPPRARLRPRRRPRREGLQRRRHPLAPAARGCRQRDFCTRGDARHVAARLPSGAVVHNLYIPAGGDIPDPAPEPEVRPQARLPRRAPRLVRRARPPERAILVGDLNVAPREDDVWNHKRAAEDRLPHPGRGRGLRPPRRAPAAGSTSPAPTSPRAGSIPGGPTAPPTGRPPTRAAASTTSGRPPTSPSAPAAAASPATSAAGRAPSDHVPVFAEFEA